VDRQGPLPVQIAQPRALRQDPQELLWYTTSGTLEIDKHDWYKNDTALRNTPSKVREDLLSYFDPLVKAMTVFRMQVRADMVV